ncbi:unnamed protein product [Dovyalis caffra]|uniref:Uncharacterized protein n=1 Tax=Dovyalis caffra TaxID=77055 RepID=A0AAV1QN96_9ROSI|nr:unnamed protein product [Dovyalis caffra]
MKESVYQHSDSNISFSKNVDKVVILDDAVDIESFDNEVTNVVALFESVEVKDEELNKVINEGITECDVATITVLDEGDDVVTIDFLGVDNSYSRRCSSLKLSFDDIGYKIFKDINWLDQPCKSRRNCNNRIICLPTKFDGEPFLGGAGAGVGANSST